MVPGTNSSKNQCLRLVPGTLQLEVCHVKKEL